MPGLFQLQHITKIVAARGDSVETKKRNTWERYTQPAIRQCFLEMLKKRPIEKISVGELCEKVDINRSTFYRHYPDLYALLNAICDEYFQLLYHDMAAQYDPAGQFEDNGQQIILQAFAVTERHKDIYRLLLCGHPAANLLPRLTDAMYQLYVDAHKKAYPQMPDAEIHYRFLVCGVIGIWQSWLLDDCRKPKEQVAEAVKLHIGGFLNVVGGLYGKPKNYTGPQQD